MKLVYHPQHRYGKSDGEGNVEDELRANGKTTIAPASLLINRFAAENTAEPKLLFGGSDMAVPGPFAWKNTLTLNYTPFTNEQMQKFKNAVDVAPSMGLSLVNLSGSQPVAYASNFTKTGFAASLMKIAPMYAAFYLQDRMKLIGPSFGTTDLGVIRNKLKEEWRTEMRAAVPRSVGDFPELAKIFVPGSFDFTGTFQSDMENMIRNSDGEATARCVHKIGFDYLNGALTFGGFYSAAAQEGMWLAGDYIADSKRKDNRDGIMPPGISTTQAANAQAVALFFVNLAKGSLISTKASDDMKLVMTNTISWVTDTLEKTHPGMKLHAKIGTHGGTTHYAGIVKYGTAHYVFVALFGWKWSIEDLIVEMDTVAQQMFAIQAAVDFVRSSIP